MSASIEKIRKNTKKSQSIPSDKETNASLLKLLGEISADDVVVSVSHPKNMGEFGEKHRVPYTNCIG